MDKGAIFTWRFDKKFIYFFLFAYYLLFSLEFFVLYIYSFRASKKEKNVMNVMKAEDVDGHNANFDINSVLEVIYLEKSF